MFGAIIGDLAGSIYEFNQTKKVNPVQINNIIEDNSFFSDDTILTIAIADAILSKCDYGNKLKEYGKRFSTYAPNFSPYFASPFSPQFTKWFNGDDNVGTSSGNGAMMRVSPVAYLFDTEEEVVENARLATIPSHNSEEAISSAKLVALIIYYARKGLSKEEIVKKLNIKLCLPQIKSFNYTCGETINLCLYSLFSSNSFEESIRLAISFGGDTDTNACIVGSMAEAVFGIDKKLKQQALSKLPVEFIEILNQCKVKNIKKKNKKETL